MDKTSIIVMAVALILSGISWRMKYIFYITTQIMSSAIHSEIAFSQRL